jgi:hypothetical protein
LGGAPRIQTELARQSEPSLSSVWGDARPGGSLATAVDRTRLEVSLCTRCRRLQRSTRPRRAKRLEADVSAPEPVRRGQPHVSHPAGPRKPTRAVSEETWATSGPWSSSLSWLGSSVAWSGSGDEAVVADAPVRCPRCNWAGRFPWLVGVDDGRNLAAVIRRADQNSVGARLPTLPIMTSSSGRSTSLMVWAIDAA